MGAQIITASGVQPTDRPEFWRHVLGEALVPLRPFGEPDRLVLGTLGAVSLGELSHAGRGGATRDARLIRRSDPDLVKIDVIGHGEGVIEQGGRKAHLRRGELTLGDLSRPSSWAMSSIRCVAVTFPRSLLPLPSDGLARLTGVRIAADTGPIALVASLARQLPGRLGDSDAATEARLGTAIVDLLTVSLAELLDRSREVEPESHRRALIRQIHAFIEARLGDPDLSPATVAAAHYISLRYLHKLFETQETTVADWIRRRRLERCRRDLMDPALRAEPVGSIGARWGLISPAHFTRLFRAAYGLPPAAYRAEANAAAADQIPRAVSSGVRGDDGYR
jgi:AraC-like DNA-binding protein